MSKSSSTELLRSAAPLTGQRAHETQAYGHLVSMPIALSESTRRESVSNLNQLLADTISLHHPTIVLTVPTLYHKLLEAGLAQQRAFGCVRRYVSAGERLPARGWPPRRTGRCPPRWPK